MLKHQIFNALEKHLQYVVKEKGIPQERIVGVFLYGSQNYGTDTPLSDVDTKVITVPSPEEIAFNKDFFSEEISLEDGSHIDIKDIRAFRENLLKQHINYMEVLFTEYSIVNPHYADLFRKDFLANREKIARIDRKRAILAAVGQALHTLSQGETDNKKFYNAKRLLSFARRYYMNEPYLDCIKVEKNSPKYIELMDIRMGKTKISNEDAVTLKEDLEEMKELVLRGQTSINENYKKLLDDATLNILKQSLYFDFFKKF